MTPNLPRWLIEAGRQLDPKTAGVAIGFAGAGYVAGWDDREATLRRAPADRPSFDERRETARKVHRIVPGVAPNVALAVVESLTVLGWRSTQITDATASESEPEPGDVDSLTESDAEGGPR